MRSCSNDANSSSTLQRRKTEGWLVEHQYLGRGEQAASDRKHLLFAAGQKTGAVIDPLPEARETLQHRFDFVLEINPGRA